MSQKPQPSHLHSLRVRFIAIVGLTTALCLGTSTLITLKLHYQQLIGSKREKATVLQETITQLFTRASSPGHRDIQAVFQTMGSHSDIRSVRLIGDESRILRSSQPDEIGLRFLQQLPSVGGENGNPIYSVVDEGVITHQQRSQTGELNRTIVAIVQRPRDERWAFLPQLLSKRSHGHPRTFSATTSIYDRDRCGRCHQGPVSASLNIGLSLAETNWSLQMVGTRLLIWTLVTTVLIGVVISLLFSRLVNTPLADLIRTMRTVEQGDLKARAALHRRDEIGLLGEKFDTMVERLGMAQEEIQRYHEEQMEQASRMASVGEMASALAHETRNPLAGISGAAQILRRDIRPDEPRHQVLSEILEQVDRLARAVNNIIRYARSRPLGLKWVALTEVLAEALGAFEAQLQECRIVTVVEAEDELQPVRIDPAQMQHAFMNLILNARKAMPGGGELRIRVRKGRERDKDVQVVEFADTGPGVPSERLEEVFKPFYAKKSGDTGLGLSVAQKIVILHGGNITVESEVGRGTSYVITIPVEGPSKTTDSSPPPSQSPEVD